MDIFNLARESRFLAFWNRKYWNSKSPQLCEFLSDLDDFFLIIYNMRNFKDLQNLRCFLRKFSCQPNYWSNVEILKNFLIAFFLGFVFFFENFIFLYIKSTNFSQIADIFQHPSEPNCPKHTILFSICLNLHIACLISIESNIANNEHFRPNYPNKCFFVCIKMAWNRKKKRKFHFWEKLCVFYSRHCSV